MYDAFRNYQIFLLFFRKGLVSPVRFAGIVVFLYRLL